MNTHSPHNPVPARPYRGRLAPTPSGHLHLGHARTFWTAFERARQGRLVMRVEDLDLSRCRPEYAAAMLADLRWLGVTWHEGPDLGGPHGAYRQRDRLDWYQEVWRRLAVARAIYPSPHSRKDVGLALQAPHDGEIEAVFPPELRTPPGAWELAENGELRMANDKMGGAAQDSPFVIRNSSLMNWRFRVPDGEAICFTDERCGPQRFVAGRDFGDFLVWRKDGLPSYELAVVADDQAMAISEVVRGEDLLLSTARQLLLYRALGWTPPAFYHTPLVRDAAGQRLAKRTDAMSLRELRQAGMTPEEVRRLWQE